MKIIKKYYLFIYIFIIISFLCIFTNFETFFQKVELIYINIFYTIVTIISIFYAYILGKEIQKLEEKVEIRSLNESEKNLNLIGKMAISVVHDLKNPISTIQTLVEMANTDQITKEERITNLNLVYREILRLSDMAYEILDFVKGKIVIDRSEVNLADFIDEVYKFLEIDFKYAGVLFQTDLQYRGMVLFDPDKIRRVFINLAKNSLEAMYDKKNEHVFLIKSSIINDKLYLTFSDNGPGLPDSIRDKLFNNFVTEGKPNGTGIGLYMAKSTMDAHGGEIQFFTESGQGTTFTLIFPMER